jgi:hypothetical protein
MLMERGGKVGERKKDMKAREEKKGRPWALLISTLRALYEQKARCFTNSSHSVLRVNSNNVTHIHLDQFQFVA